MLGVQASRNTWHMKQTGEQDAIQTKSASAGASAHYYLRMPKVGMLLNWGVHQLFFFIELTQTGSLLMYNRANLNQKMPSWNFRVLGKTARCTLRTLIGMFVGV